MTNKTRRRVEPHRIGWVIPALVTALVVSTESPGRAPDPLSAGPRYPWLSDQTYEPLAARVPPPPGYARVPVPDGSFGSWLRHLPIRPGAPPVHLFDGRPKPNQDVHVAVVLMDVGDKDLQQCADAVIRLRAEYLYSRGCDASIAFRFTSGDVAAWPEWRDGSRPQVIADRVTWNRTARPDGSHRNFRDYLDAVFTYAGSASLSRELVAVANPSRVEIGDTFIQGGSPGHAVIVVDVASMSSGDRVFLLAQSYMPAQEIHVLKNPGSPTSPWYAAASTGMLATPEWTFRYEDLRRFPPALCEQQILPVRP